MLIMGSLVDIAKYILGVLPSQFEFMYYLFAFGLGIGFIFCLFAPFIMAYKLLGRD